MAGRILNPIRITQIAALGLFWACGDSGTPPPPPPPPLPVVSTVILSANEVTLTAIGQTVTLTAVALDAPGNTISGKTFTWTSSDSGVAAVTSSGLVTAVSSGTATITATTAGIAGSASVTVTVHQTMATSTGGMAQFANVDLGVQVVDVVTEEPISGIQVTLIERGALMGLFIFDPDGEFAPVIRMVEQASGSAARSPSAGTGASTVPISLLVRLIPRPFQDEVASFVATFNRTLMGYARNTWFFECRETTLGNAFTLVDFFRSVVYEGVGYFTVLALTSFLPTGGTAAVGIGAVGLVATVGSLRAIEFNVRIVDVYRALGFSDSHRFEVCRLHDNLIGRFLDGLILLAPLEEVPPPAATASVSGTVRNATTSVAIPASVELVGPSPRGLSTIDGSFTFTNLIPGPYELSAARPGFLPSSVSFTVSGGQALTRDIALSPRLASGTLRIVLSWGVNPWDLDSHLWTPQIEGSAYHVYYFRRGSLTRAPFAELDVDDVTSFGPETITIGQTFPGTYTYAVRNFTNRLSTSSDALFRSGARVEVFSADGLLASFDVGNVTNPGIGTWWRLFTLNGATRVLTVTNRLSNSAPVSSAAVSAPKAGKR